MTQSGSERSTAPTGDDWTETCRAAAAEGRPLQLRVHTRSAAPEFGTRSYHDSVLDLVRELEDDGCVDRVEFDVWGKHLGSEGPSQVEDPVAETVETYRAWADRRGVRLPFEERQCNSMLIEESYSVLVPPHLMVCVTDGDGDVVGIAPCVDDGDPISVMDLLTQLGDHDGREDQRASASA